MQSSVFFSLFIFLSTTHFTIPSCTQTSRFSEQLICLSMSDLYGRKYSIWSFLLSLMSLPGHFYFEEYELCSHLQSLHVFFQNISIFDTNGGQFIRFVVMSNRSKYSVSKHIKVILMYFMHEATQNKLSISACKAERLLLHASNPRDSVPI